MRTREEHLTLAKQRALEYVNAGELNSALASMMSDLRKHPETQASSTWPLMVLGMNAVSSGNKDELRRWIEGFN